MNAGTAGLIVAVGLGVLVGALPPHAQPRVRTYRVGFLGNTTPALEANLVGPFRDGLRDLGYVEGRNLSELVAQRPLPPREAARYVKLIAEAIHYAHGQGILHRDL